MLLLLMFHDEFQDNGEKIDVNVAPRSSRRFLMYHGESKQYMFSIDRPENPTCSICLEPVGKDDH